ncbi:uncharacterized protein LOC117331832 [Pecten maximus]|uniref:uncharacterized protein LOC117331832 n=1 Tax=Pecten maximus TaxID=6579 RepID=UPI0014580A76|nr:uncharacterized protein LOC117331832 [Pecten maximus]
MFSLFIADGIVRDTEGGTTCEERVKIPVVGRKWNENGSSIVLEWSHTDGRVFDIQLQCDAGTERSTREIFGLRDTSVVVTRLWHDTTYHVSIWVQGRPGTKGVIDVSTLPAITSDVQFDEKKASKDVDVYNDGMRLSAKGAVIEVKSPELTNMNYPSISGTFGRRELTGSYNYWELKVKFRMNPLVKTGQEWAFDLGLYCSDILTNFDNASPVSTTYTCRAVKYGKKFARLEFGTNGNTTLLPARDLEWTNENFYFYFGFFLNLKARTFSVLDRAKNGILYTFNDIRITDNYLPMFSVSKKKNTIQEMHLGDTTQATVPDIVYEMLV